MKTNLACRHLITFALGIFLTPVSLFAASLAFDKASDPAYGGVWTNGSNGGVGWGSGWTLFVNFSATNDPAAHFISSSTNNNSSGDTNADGDIDTGGVAWGMQGNGQIASTSRSFDGTLTNGQRFVILMDNGFVASGQVGFVLQNSGFETRFQFLLGTNGVYDIQGIGPNSGVTNTAEGVRVEVEIVDLLADTAHVFVTKLIDGTSYVFSNISLNTSVATPEIVNLDMFNNSTGGAVSNRVFFNSMSILPNPADATFFADLSVGKSASLNPASVSNNFTYTITVTNNGPSIATSVVVTDTAPSSVEFVLATPSQGTCVTNDSGQLICDLGLLASNATASISLEVTPLAPGVLTNIVSVSALNVDPNSANNLATNIINAVPAVQLSVTPTNFAFSTIVTGATDQTSFVVTNLGGGTLIGTATVSSAAFSIAAGSPFAVAGFGSTNVTVSFTPPTANSFTNNVIFTSNGGVSTNVVTGTGAIAATADFTGSPTAGLAPLNVTFSDSSTGTITNRFWDFGDSVTTNTTSTNVVHQYADAGTFMVNLTVFGPLGTNTLQIPDYIIVTNLAPVADFTATPTNGAPPLSVTFTDTSTGSITNRFWDFGDLGTTNTTSTNVVHEYNSAGSFPVSLTVFGSGGSNTLTQAGFIIVTNVGPAALFSGTPTTGAAPVLVTFTNTSTGTITNQLWNFGDGSTTNAANPTHTYTNAGTFSVSLTAFGPLGSNTLTQADYIVVTNVPPVAGFTATPTNGVAALDVTFTDASSGIVTSRVWSFGDSATSTLEDPSHTYTTGGTFTVSLTVLGLGGSNTLTEANFITVTNVNVVAGFSGTPTNGGAPLLVTFTDESSGTITGRVWSFGDGDTSTATNPSHTYTNAGTFTVDLTVFGPLGSNTLTQSNYITVTNVPPVAGFTASPTNGATPLAVTFTDASSGTITGRVWSFGDSGTSTATSPSHTYTNAGTFSASLTVFGPLGSNTLARLITATNASAPSVSILRPANGMVYPPLTNLAITIVATASDPDGISKIEFFDGTNKLGEGLSSLATNVLNAPTNGIHTLTARAIDTLGKTNTSTAVTITVGGKNSPLGDWELKISGADKGNGFLTFTDDATATGYEIRLETFGLDVLSGQWGFDSKGKITGSFSERIGSSTNWTGTLLGKAKSLKSFSGSVTATNSATYKWKGVPATTFPDLSGTWSGQVTVAKVPTVVVYAITTNVTNSGVFDVATAAATNTVIGQFIATSKNAIAGYITINSNQTTLSGKFKASKSSISLKGDDEDASKVKLEIIRQ